MAPQLFPRTLIFGLRQQLTETGRLDESLEDELTDWLDLRTAPLRRADRHFWRTVIDALRELRARGELMTEGTAV
jgi:hypothetical protein